MARLIVLAGLPASGKSSIARELAAQTGAMWLRVDSMNWAIWASGTAPADLRDWTYRAVQAAATDNLRLGHDVIADCVNGWKEAKDGWQEAADRAGAEVTWIEVICSDVSEHRRRVETRTSDLPGLPLPDWDAVIDREYVPWEGDHLVVDTAHKSVAEAVTTVLAALKR